MEAEEESLGCASPSENSRSQYGVDECNSWGDYFYMEALTRLQKDWQIYW